MACLFTQLETKQGVKAAAEVLSGKLTAIYFSAHWCPPCRGFTPKLAEAYTKHLQAKGVEVVFVSSDRDEAAFKEYFGSMPWVALPFADRTAKQALSEKFGVSGIPMLVVVDETGQVVSTEGRRLVMEDPTGSKLWPWLPKLADRPSTSTVASETTHPLFETLVTKSGTKPAADVLSGKNVAIYFSAHWCPPCRGFTPKLAEAYTKHLQAKGVEVVFVSSDQDEAAFKEYFGSMPWVALPFADRTTKQELSEKFGVRGIPSLVLVDETGNAVSTDGRGLAMQDPTGSTWPWAAASPAKVQSAPSAPVHAQPGCCTIA